jgi:hypothetical protein
MYCIPLGRAFSQATLGARGLWQPRCPRALYDTKRLTTGGANKAMRCIVAKSVMHERSSAHHENKVPKMRSRVSIDQAISGVVESRLASLGTDRYILRLASSFDNTSRYRQLTRPPYNLGLKKRSFFAVTSPSSYHLPAVRGIHIRPAYTGLILRRTS